MKTISISEARNHLPTIIDTVLNTREQVVVMRHGAPTVTIAPFQATAAEASRYPLRGRPLRVAADFDAPMPDLWEALDVAEAPGAYAAEPTARRRHSPSRTAAKTPAGKPGNRRRKG